MLGSLLAHSLPRCKRLKSVLCVGSTALLIFLTAVFISCFLITALLSCSIEAVRVTSPRYFVAIYNWSKVLPGSLQGKERKR
jgi:hypothetical protein